MAAMKGVFRDYCKRETCDITTDINPEFLANKVAERHIINDSCIEDSAYDFIMEAGYRGTFVETLYRNLGRAYVKAVETSKELNDTDIDRIELGVAVELLLDFSCPKFMQACG